MTDSATVLASDLSESKSASTPDAQPSRRRGYFSSTRSLVYALILTWPLLLIYELGNHFQNVGQVEQVKNGADALLELVLTGFGYASPWHITLGLVLILVVAAAVEVHRRPPAVRLSYLTLAMIEATMLSFLLGPLSNWLMNPSVSLLAMLRLPGLPSIDGLFGNIVGSFGAGFYEEVVFRVLLVGGLLGLLKLFRVRSAIMFLCATLIGAAIFSGMHHLGALGDPFTFRVFFFRMAAGVVFNIVYMTRGFAIAAWTHALYDVWVSTGML